MSRDKGQYGAYTSNQVQIETVRQTDARALLNCASKLEATRRPESTKDDYREAIKHNMQLWTIFQVCVTEPDSTLPNDLKLLILRISRFVDKASMVALTKYDPACLEALITINRQIAAGLSQGAPTMAENKAPPLPTGNPPTAYTPPNPYQPSAYQPSTPYGAGSPPVQTPGPDKKPDQTPPSVFTDV